MADKLYTVVAAVKVDKVFDNKYKTILPKVIKSAAEAGIADSKSGLTSQKPTDKSAKTYSLDVTVSSLTFKADTLELFVNLVVSEENNVAGYPKGHSKLPSKNPKELDDDVEALVDGVVHSTVATTVRKTIDAFIAKNR